MNEDEFLTAVRSRADLDSDADARAATTATLETVGERLVMGEVEDLGALLPGPLADSLREYGQRPGAFSFEEFLAKVDDRAELEDANPLDVSRAVGVTFAEAVGSEELDDARAQLPPEFDRLFWSVDAEEFLNAVRRSSNLDSTEQAHDAAVATLHVLGDRLSMGEAEQLRPSCRKRMLRRSGRQERSRPTTTSSSSSIG